MNINIIRIIIVVSLVVFWQHPYAETDSLFPVATALLVMDWAQTRSLAVDPNYREKNPILGSYPSTQAVDAYFAAATLTTFFVRENVSKRNRKRFLYGLIAVEAYAVSRNHKIGVRIDF